MSLAEELRASLERSRQREHNTTIYYSDMRDTVFPEEQPGVDAAVLIPVVARPEPTVILTQRTQDLSSHPGQVAFPGGKIDPGDDGPIGAALREAKEEIGLEPRHVEIVGVTDLYRTGTGFHITPVLGVVPPDLPLAPHEAEVADIFEVPFDILFATGNYEEKSLEWQGRMRQFYEMYWEERRIWGATAAMIINLGRRLELGR